jgi:hypothetical protein
MKKLILVMLVMSSFSAIAAPKDQCKSVALKIASAVDKVYIPKLVRGTKISAELTDKSSGSVTWVVNYMVPNAGGQTAYEMVMDAEGCSLMTMNVFAE